MILYVIPILLGFISCFKPLNQDKYWGIFLPIYLCIFLCFGYMCGSDWRNYEVIYNNINLAHLYDGYLMEPGFYLLMLPFKYLNLNFWSFIITCKTLTYVVIYSFFRQFLSSYTNLALMVFIPFWGYYLFIDNPLRNMLAISVFLLSFKYILQKKFYKYLVCCLISTSIHISGIITIAFYFIINKRISTVCYIIIAFLCIVFFNEQFVAKILYNIKDIQYVAWKIDGYNIGESGSHYSIKILVHLFFFFLLLKYRRHIEQQFVGSYILNSALLYVILYIIGCTVNIFYRFQLFLCIPYTIAIVYLINAFIGNYKICYIVFLFLLSVSALSSVRMLGYKYVPYTNYLFYMFDDPPMSYWERSIYNLKHTPYPETINNQ